METVEGLVETFNDLIKGYVAERDKGEEIKTFAGRAKERIVFFSGNEENTIEVVKAVQIMVQQVLMIMCWIDRGIAGAADIRLTANNSVMARNDKRGNSYLDVRSLPSGVVRHGGSEDAVESKEEGKPGYYWRGVEGVSKLGEDIEDTKLPKNVVSDLIYDSDAFKENRNKLVMYIMNHGFEPVPERLIKDTEDGKVSTNHETGFTADTLPGSCQTLSTGPGHFQARKMDLKKVVSGRGVQFNVRYDKNGNIVEVIAQYLFLGSWTVSLPGHVDYMVNLGSLMFDDMSVELSQEAAKSFNRDFDFSKESIGVIEAAIKDKGIAPYAGAVFPDGTKGIVKATDDTAEARWANDLSGGIGEAMSLSGIDDVLDYYRSKEPGAEGELAYIVERALKDSFANDPGDKPTLVGEEDALLLFTKKEAGARVSRYFDPKQL